jgi:thiamine-monophosphate kinase
MSSKGTPLGPGGEFDAIRELIARFGDTASGIGDDAAILDVPRGEQLVVSTDACVENRHFRLEWLSPEEIGYRAVTAALSDIAAMAARPIAVLWAVNLPARCRPMLAGLADGVREGARAVGAKIVGGNLAAAEELSLTTTVIGTAYRPLRRDGAKPGEKLYVTGRLGGPAMALAALSSNRKADQAHRARFAHPTARIAEARWLADRGITAGLDISDGLVGDARHLAAASGVGLTVHLDRLPRFEGADAVTAARSGEEYELLVTARTLEADAFAQAFGLPLTEIGEVTSSGTVQFLDRGQAVQVGAGHDHLS